MDAEDFFARLLPQFAHRASSVEYAVSRQAEADALIAKAEYELFDVQRELAEAFAVPLRYRAIAVPAPVHEEVDAEPVLSGVA
jgi:hypothetical protein